MLKVAGCWDSRMGDVILGCAGCTPTWVSAFNSFLLLLHMFLVTDNPSRQQLSSQPARSLALPAFVSFVFWTSEHISTMLHSAVLQAVLTTSSVHLVWQPGALSCCFLDMSLDALLSCWPPEAQVRLLWQSWINPEPEWAEPFLWSWVEACSLLLGRLGRGFAATVL